MSDERERCGRCGQQRESSLHRTESKVREIRHAAHDFAEPSDAEGVGGLNVHLFMEALLHDVKNCATVEEAVGRVEHYAKALQGATLGAA